MEFLNNIGKEYILSNDYKNRDIIHFGDNKIMVEITDLDLYQGTFRITNVDNSDIVVEKIIEGLLKELDKDSKKLRKVLNKVIKGWEENPEFFTRIERNWGDEMYNNPYLIPDTDEYISSVCIFHNKISFHYGHIGTGWGGDSYFNKNNYVKQLEGLDKFVDETKKTINSSKFKTKIKNGFKTIKLEIRINDIIKYISVPTKVIPKVKGNRPNFPVQFKGWELITLLDHVDQHGYIDDELIESMKDDDSIDISKLKDFSIGVESKGEMYHDSQVLEYEVTFISPDGDIYSITDERSAMFGWTFVHNKIVEIN